MTAKRKGIRCHCGRLFYLKHLYFAHMISMHGRADLQEEYDRAARARTSAGQ